MSDNHWIRYDYIREVFKRKIMKLKDKQAASDFAGDRSLGGEHGWPSWTASCLQKGFINGITYERKENENLAETIVADIRNKMGYVSNLLSLLRLKEGVPSEHEEYLDERIAELLTKSEESIEYLRQIKIKDFKKKVRE